MKVYAPRQEELEKNILRAQRELADFQKQLEIEKIGTVNIEEEGEIEKAEGEKSPKINRIDLLNYFFVDKLVRIKGRKIKASELLDKINKKFNPKIKYSHHELSHFLKSKGIEKIKISSFIYYLDIDFSGKDAAKLYIQLNEN